jgi:hypothetical protein
LYLGTSKNINDAKYYINKKKSIISMHAPLHKSINQINNRIRHPYDIFFGDNLWPEYSCALVLAQRAPGAL